MLTLESVNPSGMFSFGEEEDIPLNNVGLIHLLGVNLDTHGGSNGSGKSSVFNALCELLFGENPTQVSGDAVSNNVWGKGFGGRVVFTSWEGIRCRVTYCRKWKIPNYISDNDNRAEYRGTALFFDREIDGGWVDHRGAAMAQTRQRIQTAVGLSYDQFVAVSYMSPRASNLLLRGANKDRVDVLSGIVGLGEWDRVLDNIRAKKRALFADHGEAKTKHAYGEGQLAQLTERYDVLKAHDIDGDLLVWRQSIADAEVVIGEKTTLCEALALRSAELDSQLHSEWGNDTAAALRSEVDTLKARTAELQREKVVLRVEADTDVESRLMKARTGLEIERGKADVYRSDNPLLTAEKCPTCGSKITKAARLRMDKGLAEADTRIQECQRTVEEIAVEKKEHADRQQEVMNKRRLKYDEEISALDVEVSDKTQQYNESLSSYTRVQKEVEDHRRKEWAVKQDLADAQQQHRSLTTSMSQCEVMLQERDQMKQQVDTQQAVVTDMFEHMDALEIQIKHYDWYISNIPYIKLHKLSVALETLTTSANQYLDQMGDTIRVDISSFSEKKGAKRGSQLMSDVLKSDISVEVVDGEKRINPKLYSEGESARITNALVRALHDLAVKSGHGCNVTMMDEIFSFMDSDSSQRIAESFSDFPGRNTVFVTDNSGVVKNLMTFKEVWTVRKSNGVSKLER